MARRDTVVRWVLLVLYVLGMFVTGVAIGHLTAPAPPAPPPAVPAPVAGFEP